MDNNGVGGIFPFVFCKNMLSHATCLLFRQPQQAQQLLSFLTTIKGYAVLYWLTHQFGGGGEEDLICASQLPVAAGLG